MICGARDVVDLVSADPFPRAAPEQEVRRFVSVLTKRPTATSRTPFRHPTGSAWQVEVCGIRGRFVLSLWRRTGSKLVCPNEVVEKRLAVAATTRSWNTLIRIQDALETRRTK